jgi:nucleotide-binding universal stress UspA family protein
MAHVIMKNASTDEESVKEKHKIAENKFVDLLKKYDSRSKLNFKLGYTIKQGIIFKEIAALGEASEDSLVVLSTHGESGFEDLFIGGNAYKITSHSKRPVITVRRCSVCTNIDKIVLPLDITLQTREKVPYTVELAKLFNSEIHLLTVRLTNIKSIEKKLHQYAEQVGAYIHNQNIPYTVEHLQGKNLTDITIDYAQHVSADLISIMTEQEKSISNLLLGNYAHQMINKALIPVLSFPTYHLGIMADDFKTQGISY